MFQLTIEKTYSNCYPKEQSESNCFTITCNTIEEAHEYVNRLTGEYGVKHNPNNLMGLMLHTYQKIDKQATKEDIMKLLRDPNDYDHIPKRDIEMYSISVWIKKMKQKWKDTSGNLREFTFIPPNLLEVVCHDVLYTSIGGTEDNLVSIDPDGGPCLFIGKKVNNYKIKKIISYQKISKRLKIMLEVEI